MRWPIVALTFRIAASEELVLLNDRRCRTYYHTDLHALQRLRLSACFPHLAHVLMSSFTVGAGDTGIVSVATVAMMVMLIKCVRNVMLVSHEKNWPLFVGWFRPFKQSDGTNTCTTREPSLCLLKSTPMSYMHEAFQYRIVVLSACKVNDDLSSLGPRKPFQYEIVRLLRTKSNELSTFTFT